MKPIKVKRTWHGVVSIRSTQWQKACDAKAGIVIRCQGQEMSVSYDELKYLTPRGTFTDKFDKTKTYGLVDIKWNPNPITTQGKLL
ncbi:MAG: hypothetical protein Tp1100SUR435061_24 [Prokaryotic dsDNA virus sp.]|nr:MAG: hypothetical protein Tp1100SUR435061_24 [Prokaryotic dsDNA virus sp.]|tara:strand:+ start:494 stop:751 length:258 start_codon:yes stop_codon:yes gene_type:complete